MKGGTQQLRYASEEMKQYGELLLKNEDDPFLGENFFKLTFYYETKIY